MKTLKLFTLFIAALILGSTSAQTCDATFTSTNPSTGVFVFTNPGVYGGYYWDFGDGNTANGGQTVTNVYAYNGIYEVCLIVYDSISQCSATSCDSILVTGLTPPPASCDASFTTALDSNTCNTIYYGADNSNYSDYYWYFGDGTSASNVWGTHTYTTDGTYTIQLTVMDYDSAGNYICGDTMYQTVVINCNGFSTCDASAMLVDSSGYLYGIPNSYSSNYVYHWDFGDGTTSNQPYPWHQYASSGTYNVCLTVIDSLQGCSDTQCYTFTVVSPSSCNASFILFQDSINAGVYYAWNMSTGNNISYFWDFGDGNTSTQAYPIHTYSAIGVYQLCLTVTNGSCTSTYCDTLNVVVKANGTTLGVSPAGQFAAIEDVNSIEEVNLYPNPNNGQFNLNITLSQGGEFTISVLNYVGQIIESNTIFLNAGENQFNMNIEDQPKGVYLVSILDEVTKSNKIIKVIKE